MIPPFYSLVPALSNCGNVNMAEFMTSKHSKRLVVRIDVRSPKIYTTLWLAEIHYKNHRSWFTVSTHLNHVTNPSVYLAVHGEYPGQNYRLLGVARRSVLGGHTG